MESTRYERKFLSHTLSSTEAETFIRNHEFHFRSVFSQRTINNIYFDSPSFNCFYDHVNGIYERYKLRIRWYGDTFGNLQNPVLEIKTKTGYAGKKTSFYLAPFKFNPGISFEWKNYFRNADLPPEVENKLLMFSPVLVNTYVRKYYISADNIFRITVDSNLEYYAINNLTSGLLSIPDSASVILEIKYGSAYELRAGTLSEVIPLPLTKSSKYLRGIQRVYFL